MGRLSRLTEVFETIACYFRFVLGQGCCCCGEKIFTEFDGKMYCIDHWPGYDNCQTPGCNHYMCEHSFGETWECTYVKPDLPDDATYNEGDVISFPVGCMNYGCECKGFVGSEYRRK